MNLQILFVVSLIAHCLAVQNFPPNQCEITVGPETFSKSILFRGHPGKRGPIGPPGPAGSHGTSCDCQHFTEEIDGLKMKMTKTIENLTETNDRLNEAFEQLNEQSEIIKSLKEITKFLDKKDCSHVALETGDGVADISPIPFKSVRALCDMTTAPGGWTVIQRRYDGSVDFYQNWNSYVEGFGDPSGEYWLGLETLHAITKEGNHMLRIDLKDREGNVGHATYSTFVVGSKESNYSLQISGYEGNIGDSMSGFYSLDGMAFSTYDNDKSSRSCAKLHKGAWWYRNCAFSNLNGDYSVRNGDKSVMWFQWKDNQKAMRSSKMMVRPKE